MGFPLTGHAYRRDKSAGFPSHCEGFPYPRAGGETGMGGASLCKLVGQKSPADGKHGEN